MKVGILTYHRAYNYGAVWQAYALKRFLELGGHQVELIDYWPKYHAEHFSFIPSLHFKVHFKNMAAFIDYMYRLFNLLFGLNRIIKRRKGFQRFFEKQLGLGKSVIYRKPEDLNGIDYDAVICGSDQIWRYWKTNLFRGFDTVYFCDFSFSGKRISYAASMGVIEGVEVNSDKLAKLWKGFDALSVRESSLRDLVIKYSNCEPVVVLDPVFLLSKENWDEIIPSSIKNTQKYILFYHLMNSKEALILVQKLSEKYNLPVYEVHGNIIAKRFGKRYSFSSASPIELLGLIRDAAIVVSTSFHGVALSLIFEKEFYALGMANKADRAKTLLKHLDLEERYLENADSYKEDEPIRWEDVSFKREVLLKRSISFLSNVLILK